MSKKLNIEDSGFKPHFDSYLDYLEIHNYANSTINRHDSKLRRFIHWCDSHGIDSPKEVSKPLIERYQRQLYRHRIEQDKPYAINTQISYMQAVINFFQWLTRQNHLLYNPASGIVMPKKPNRLPVVLNPTQIEKLMSQPNTEVARGIRDRAILELFYSTGIRRSELIGLQLSEVSIEQQTLWVRQGKGNKDRVLPIGERACYWLGAYLQVRDGLLQNTADRGLMLFVNNQASYLTSVCLTFSFLK